jgi:hypothetical protein
MWFSVQFSSIFLIKTPRLIFHVFYFYDVTHNGELTPAKFVQYFNDCFVRKL